LRKEVQTIERVVEKAFDLIKEDIEDSIHILERVKNKRNLTKEEDIIIERLRNHLSEAEKVIRKEVQIAQKDIDK
jgi:SMC interacting uncharacterized protein involved in chromosome segregation